MKMEQSASKHRQKRIQTPGNHPKERIKRIVIYFCFVKIFSIVTSPDWRRRKRCGYILNSTELEAISCEACKELFMSIAS